MVQFLIKSRNDLIQKSPYQCIDCTYFLPNEEKILFDKSQKINHDDIFFDLDKIADINASFSHTFPPKSVFLQYCTEKRINYGKNYIFYDHKGIFSAPRAYFTFLAYGFKNIFVLDGGFSALGTIGHHENVPEYHDTETLNLSDAMPIFINSDYVKQAITSDKYKIIDARPSGRFNGTHTEPRQGLQSGHIPNSINLPFTDLLTLQKTYKSVTDIMALFARLGITKNHTLIFTCGSGITACVVAFAAVMCGFHIENIKIYDASWCEWGNGNFDVVTS